MRKSPDCYFGPYFVYIPIDPQFSFHVPVNVPFDSPSHTGSMSSTLNISLYILIYNPYMQ